MLNGQWIHTYLHSYYKKLFQYKLVKEPNLRVIAKP